MTENEAIKEIMHGVCNYKGISKFCHDKCMVEKEKCEFSMAIKALEEIQQYRAIGTVEECQRGRECVHNKGFTITEVLFGVHELGLGYFPVSIRWDWGQNSCPHLWVHYIHIGVEIW